MATLPPIDASFIALAGELAESFSFNRSLGQVYGLLYFSTEPLSLGEVALRLGMSKGNASINLRTLEAWEAVRSVAVSGSRQDFYEADRDLKAVALRRLREGVGRRLDAAERRLRELSSRKGELKPEAGKRVAELTALIGSARRALVLLPKFAVFLK